MDKSQGDLFGVKQNTQPRGSLQIMLRPEHLIPILNNFLPWEPQVPEVGLVLFLLYSSRGSPENPRILMLNKRSGLPLIVYCGQ